jgi:hypothetical protein
VRIRSKIDRAFSFGTLSMQADSWHTDAAGYDLIAKALLETLKGEGSVRRYLERIGSLYSGRRGRAGRVSSHRRDDGENGRQLLRRDSKEGTPETVTWV